MKTKQLTAIVMTMAALGVHARATTFGVGTTKTGKAGTSAKLTLLQKANSVKFNFTIPRGATGPQGAVGPAGPQGATGPAGGTTIADGSITLPKLASNIGVFLANGPDVYWNGKVGIGTSAPATQLQIGSYGSSDQALRISTAGGNQFRASIDFRHSDATNGFSIVSDERGAGPSGLHFIDATGANRDTRMYIANDSGNVGIGTTTPSNRFSVRGAPGAAAYQSIMQLANGTTGQTWNFDIENQFAGDLILYNTASGGPFGRFAKTTATYSTSSDRRLKKEIEPITSVLGKVMQLHPVTYRFNSEADDAPRSMGFIAQEVEPLFPEVVTTTEKSGELHDVKSLAYAQMVTVAIGATQELKNEKDAQIEELRAANAALAKQLAVLESRDAAWEARLARLESSGKNQTPHAVPVSFDPNASAR